MNSKAIQRTILGTILTGGMALSALAQIPLPPLPGLEVRITTGHPPALRHEVRSTRPGSDYVWVNGSWDWDGGHGGHWRWVDGRWDRPAVAHGYWIPARYVRTSHSTIYEPGHWSNQQVVVNEDIRKNKEWRKHERDHERELEHERNRDYYHDRN